MPWPKLFKRYVRLVDRASLRLAGHLAIADLEHVGRTTGTVRHTPVRAFRVGPDVAVGLNFGRGSNWYRNIAAAGGCRMRLGREWLELGAPRLVPVDEGTVGMPRSFAWSLRHVVHTEDVVRLPVLNAVPVARRRRHRRSGD